MFDRSTRFGSLYIDWRYREIESPRQHVTATSSHPRHLLDHRLNRGKAGIANKENVDECWYFQIHVSVCLSVCLSLCLSVSLSVCLSVCLSKSFILFYFYLTKERGGEIFNIFFFFTLYKGLFSFSDRLHVTPCCCFYIHFFLISICAFCIVYRSHCSLKLITYFLTILPILPIWLKLLNWFDFVNDECRWTLYFYSICYGTLLDLVVQPSFYWICPHKNNWKGPRLC